MASDVMRMRMHLREIRVLAVASDTPSELRVEVESTVRRSRCPECGSAAPGCTNVGGHEIMPGGGHVGARWWSAVLLVGGRLACLR